LYDLFGALDEKIMYLNGPRVTHHNTSYPLRLVSDLYGSYSVWDMENQTIKIKDEYMKINRFVSISKRATGNDIYKFNQQYRLSLNYNFAGPHLLEERVRKQLIEQISTVLPTGYTAKDPVWNWQQEEESQYLLILLVIAIIYFVCAILLESLLQPLAIIGLIPVSFIGLFLTFYLFDLNFDQGGWAAFILLSGLSVNAGLYILNDYNNFRRKFPGRDLAKTYFKAFQYKITPVLLTILSTVLGLIPFLTGTPEPFWFAFAAGTIGGLIFSIFGVLFFLPALIRMKSTKETNKTTNIY
jgi:multidrug efflux pump subunit AcrB